MHMKRYFSCGLLLLILLVIALLAGRYGTNLQDMLASLCFHGDAGTQAIVWNIRIPRILLVLAGGGALAVSGLIYQTIFKNPLASGDVIGASSGCSLGAALAIVLFHDEPWITMLLAFGCGLLLVIFTMLLATKVHGNRILNLVIAGIILQAVATSFLMLLKLAADPYQELASIEYWLMGGFGDATWTQALLCIGVSAVCMISLYLLRWQIQMLSFGEETTTLGVREKQIRWIALLLSTCMIATVVSVAGIVSWVGLLIPHAVRLLYHQPLSKALGKTFFGGACFLLVCDTLARAVLAIELPISILTSLFGAFFLIIVFVKGRFSL